MNGVLAYTARLAIKREREEQGSPLFLLSLNLLGHGINRKRTDRTYAPPIIICLISNEPQCRLPR